MTIESLLEEIESILEEGKSVPFTSNLLVDANAIKTAIEDIRLNMPDELMQARKSLQKEKKFLQVHRITQIRLSKKHIFVQKKSFQKTRLQEVQRFRLRKLSNRQDRLQTKSLNRQEHLQLNLQSRQEHGQEICVQVQVNMLKASLLLLMKLSQIQLTKFVVLVST